MTTQQALEEARRRWFLRSDGDHTGGQTLTTAWTGLGTKTDYKGALEHGIMEWATTAPAPRCIRWLRLTDKGAAMLFTRYGRQKIAKAVFNDS